MSVSKKKEPIVDLDRWGEIAGPKSPDQWVAGRSAMETARYWLKTGDAFPADLSDVLQQHGDFSLVSSWTAEPEVKLRFDKRKGEPRNTDLLVLANDNFGSFVIALEAKADESFGDFVPEALAAALEAKLKNPRSQALPRVIELVQRMFAAKADGAPRLSRIRYQLLTATAGVLAEAVRRESDRALLVIQEFCSDKTSDQIQAENAKDLNAFIHRLTNGAVTAVPNGQVIGPLNAVAPALGDRSPKFYVLKVTCDLRAGV